VLQRVVVSQEVERRNTPGHKGCVLQCVLQYVLQSVSRQRGGIPSAKGVCVAVRVAVCVAVSQQAERRNTPGHQGFLICS